jgi:hypothetical protein
MSKTKIRKSQIEDVFSQFKMVDDMFNEAAGVPTSKGSFDSRLKSKLRKEDINIDINTDDIDGNSDFGTEPNVNISDIGSENELDSFEDEFGGDDDDEFEEDETFEEGIELEEGDDMLREDENDEDGISPIHDIGSDELEEPSNNMDFDDEFEDGDEEFESEEGEEFGDDDFDDFSGGFGGANSEDDINIASDKNKKPTNEIQQLIDELITQEDGPMMESEELDEDEIQIDDDGVIGDEYGMSPTPGYPGANLNKNTGIPATAPQPLNPNMGNIGNNGMTGQEDGGIFPSDVDEILELVDLATDTSQQAPIPGGGMIKRQNTTMEHKNKKNRKLAEDGNQKKGWDSMGGGDLKSADIDKNKIGPDSGQARYHKNKPAYFGKDLGFSLLDADDLEGSVSKEVTHAKASGNRKVGNTVSTPNTSVATPSYETVKKEAVTKTKALYSLADKYLKLENANNSLKLNLLKAMKANSILTYSNNLKESTRVKIVERFDSCADAKQVITLYKQYVNVIKENQSRSANDTIVESTKSSVKYLGESMAHPNNDDDNINEDQKRINYLMGFKGYDDQYSY